MEKEKETLIKGLSSLNFDGLIKYIKEGNAKNVVFLTGAGTSVAAGIPDFRSPNIGIYYKVMKLKLPYPTAIFDIKYFRKHPEPFFKFIKDMHPETYKPTVAHYLPLLFERHGMLLRFYTQNVDGLDRKAGLSEEKIVESHGTFATLTCPICHRKAYLEEYEADLRSGDVVHCHECKKGVIKPDVVFFGECLPKRFFRCSDEDLEKADLIIVMGTSLNVSPCNLLPKLVGKGCVRVLINNKKAGDFSFDKTDNKRDIFLKGDVQDICSRIIDSLGWKEEYTELSGKELPLYKEYPDYKREPFNNKIIYAILALAVGFILFYFLK